MINAVEEIEVVVAHSERATLRVGDVFLKIDTDQARIDREVEVMARAPIPTPEVLWRKPSVPAFAAIPGVALGHGVLSANAVRRNRLLAEAALRPWAPVFIHGDLQIVHVFVDGDEVTGVVDWSEGGEGDAMHDLATLTLAHEEHLEDVIEGYGVDMDVIRAYWSLRSLMSTRWLVEHGYGAPATFPEVAVLISLAGRR